MSYDRCWIWPSTNQDGYASDRAHRKVYEAAVGPIPEGMEIDHTCHDPDVCQLGKECPHRACVNPAHLEVVTRLENVRRSMRTRCVNDHEPNWSDYKPGGSRSCRTCRTEERVRRKAAQVEMLRDPAVLYAVERYQLGE